ncbi:MAG: NUDIX domain-containing protein [Spirochaetes bacterium]|nr:NUDIX domain-containing protein [Spirochaetota bacterium]MBU1080733.1 NUDIX domain-containing protein [Spirochaetota bacterium]
MRSIAGVAVRGNRVFMARRAPGGEMGGKWEFPGGKCEPGETDGEAAVREFDEEFGLRVTVGATLGQASFEHGGKRYDLAALLVSFDGEPPVLSEHVEARWADAAELGLLDLSDSDRSLVPFVLPLLAVGIE